MGRVIDNNTYTNVSTVQMNLPNESGVYFLTIDIDGRTVVKRISKK
jgi:hypothetical protein